MRGLLAASKGMVRGRVRNCPEPHVEVSLQGYQMCPQVTSSRGGAEPPICGVLACENDSTCFGGGVNLKECNPDGRFKILSARHSCGLQVAFGLSGATPTAAAKQCYSKLPQGQLL